MAKKVLQITDFSGGLNAYSDAKDIKDNQFTQNWNAIVDKAGVIRFAGQGTDNISTDYHDNSGFLGGYGLYQFNTDYSLTSIDGNFNTGITTGTVASGADTSNFVLEDKTSTSSINDYYRSMIIFIYDGTNIGESRRISSYVGSSRTVTVQSAFTATPTSTSKYIIYRWSLDGVNWTGSAVDKDIATNGDETYYASNIKSILSNDYFLYTKKTAEDNKSVNLGSISYNGKNHFEDTGVVVNQDRSVGGFQTCNVDGDTATDSILLDKDLYVNSGTIDLDNPDNYYLAGPCVKVNSGTQISFGSVESDITDSKKLYTSGMRLKSAVRYTITFECAALQKWTNSISDGESTGLIDTGIVSNESVNYPTFAGQVVTVDGTSATDALILNQDVYLSDGTFIGTCTARGSGTSITFGNGLVSRLEENQNLYTKGHGDKVPYVTLESPSVSDESGCLATFDTLTHSSNFTEGEYFAQFQNSSTGVGTGAMFYISVNGSSVPSFYSTSLKGGSYIVNEKLTFKDPGGNGNTCTIDVASINNIGLSLYSGNTWIRKTNQSKYNKLQGSNYIRNGDFALGTGSGWSTSGSKITFSEGSATSEGYDGDDGSLKMVSAEDFTNTTEPDTYIKQQMTLDNLTKYNLNFLFDSADGIQYALYNVTLSQYLIGWTTIGASRGESESQKYIFANEETVSFYSTGENSTTNYIQFDVQDGTTAETSTIELRFSNIRNSSIAFLHGVIVNKSCNDLITMGSRCSQSSNPYKDSIKGLSKFSLNFKIPKGFNDANDWILKFHAGDYGFRNSNTLGQTSTQEVYFDNIKISSEEFDTITLLSNNTSNYTDISLYSEVSKTWITNMIRWGAKAKPIYNYVNGMLKVCDANFETNNGNILLYYNEKASAENYVNNGWIFAEKIIPDPPSVKARTVSSFRTGYFYDACPYLNAFWQDEFFATTNITPDGTENAGEGRNVSTSKDPVSPGSSLEGRCGWRMDVFGAGRIYDIESDAPNSFSNNPYYTTPAATHNGAVIHYTAHREDETHGNFTKDTITGGNAGYRHHLLDTNNLWFYNNLDPGTNPTTPEVNARDVCLANRGHDSDGNNYLMVSPFKGGTQEFRARNPIQFIVNGSESQPNNSQGFNTGELSMEAMAPENAGVIESVSFKINRYSYFRHNSWGEDNYPDNYYIKIGRPSNISVEQMKEKARTGDGVSFLSNDSHAYLEIGITPVIPENHSEYYKTYNIDQTQDLLRYDANDNIKSFAARYSDAGYPNSEGAGANEDCGIECEIPISHLQIRKDEIILVEIGLRLHEEGHYNRHGNYVVYRRNAFCQGGYTHSHGTGNSYTLNENSDIFTTIFISDIDIRFLRDGYNENLSEYSISGGNETQVNFDFKEPKGESSSGWGGRTFKLATTSVNIFGEESHLSESDIIVGQNDEEEPNIGIGHCPEMTVYIGDGQLKNPYISKTKYYMRDSESEIYFLQFYIDHSNYRLHSTVSNGSASRVYSPQNSISTFNLGNEYFKNFNEVNSYESETMVSQEDAISSANLQCDYKTSVVANNRLYVANIMQNNRVYGDRMLKSPIGKYNILPKSNFIDVAINDGDEVTALSYYKDKILQFKKRKLFIINVSGDYEFLEETYQNVGVNEQCQVVSTPHGIVWANVSGCYIYDGKELKNLIDNIIPATSDYASISNNYWVSSSISTSDSQAGLRTGTPVVGYIQNRDTIILKYHKEQEQGTSLSIPDGASYHFPTKSWAFIQKGFSGDAADTSSGALSNMITDKNGDVLYYRYLPSSVSGATANNSIKKWNNNSTISTSTSIGRVFYFTTKNFTFGDISVRKKIYKVYVTYKSTSSTKIYLQAAKNSSSSFSYTFANANLIDTSTSTYSETSLSAGNGFLSTSGEWKTAEFKFITPSDYNNIYSFQLSFQGGISTSSDFEVNDISIIYRDKKVK